jgi:hypothetical protein
MLEPSKTREFERAMAELQQGLWIIKTEERYEPSFSYRWDLLERWLPDAAAEGRRLGRAAAIDLILARHLSAAVCSTPATVSRLFGIGRTEVEGAAARLQRSGVLRAGVEIDGHAGRWLVRV